MPGYSGTPLVRKIGIKDGFRVLVINAPTNYQQLLAPLPPDVQFVSKGTATTNVVHLFTTKRAELTRVLTTLRNTLAGDAMVWVSWPKKSAKVPTDITEDVIRAVALPMGWVDIKVCAVTDVWSGLKLVVRKELR
ncbi:MAG: DUF3052 domain-containing protein [Gemmatimonadaceae bacterium]